jgi:hypothetical protein
LNLISGSPIPNLFEHFPASFHAYVDRGASHNLARTLKEVSAAGVDTRLIFDDEGNSFSGAYSVPSSAALGIEDNTLFEIDTGFYLDIGDVRYIEPYPDKSTLGHSQDSNPSTPFSYTIRDDIKFASRSLLEIEDNTLFEIDTGFYLEFRDAEE